MNDYSREPMECTCEEYQCPCHNKLKIAIAALDKIMNYCDGRAVYDIAKGALDQVVDEQNEDGRASDCR